MAFCYAKRNTFKEANATIKIERLVDIKPVHHDWKVSARDTDMNKMDTIPIPCGAYSLWGKKTDI